jgi:prepilin signal peptidase PulO-like enzyme (type II secretory pathway)
MQGFITIVWFALGACVGSFINVIIYRLPRHISFVRWGERSICPFCKKQLIAKDLIPIVSFLLLHGKCRHCKRHISWQYILVEMLFGFAFAFSFFSFGWSYDFVAALAIIFFVVPLVIIDARHKVVPDALSIPFIVVAAILSFLSGSAWYVPLVGAGIGGGFFLLQWFLSRGKWIGSGDIRIGFAMGFLLGWQLLLVALALAYFTGTLVAIIALATRKKKLQSMIAFGPYLLLAMVVAFFWGAKIIDWYLSIYIYPI